MSAQANGLGEQKSDPLSPNGAALLPRVSFIQLNSMALTQLTKLILKRHPTVVFLLVLDVLLDLRNIRLAYRKRSVSALPCKITRVLRLLLEPLARFGFCFLDHLHNGKLAAQQTQGMNVIFYTIDDDRGRVDVVAQDRGFVCVQFFAQLPVLEPWSPMLR